jgi:hypothetical protein
MIEFLKKQAVEATRATNSHNKTVLADGRGRFN